MSSTEFNCDIEINKYNGDAHTGLNLLLGRKAEEEKRRKTQPEHCSHEDMTWQLYDLQTSVLRLGVAKGLS